MISVKLQRNQNIFDFIALVEAWRQFNNETETYTVEFGSDPYYIIESGSRRMVDWIRANAHVNTIHRNDNRI
jgi:hypothetical protein